MINDRSAIIAAAVELARALLVLLDISCESRQINGKKLIERDLAGCKTKAR